MGLQIHVIKSDGNFKFRIWSTERDCYFSEELTEEQARKYWLIRLLENVTRDINRELVISSVEQLKSLAKEEPWQEEVQHDDLNDVNLNEGFAEWILNKSADAEAIAKALDELFPDTKKFFESMSQV